MAVSIHIFALLGLILNFVLGKYFICRIAIGENPFFFSVYLINY